MNRSLALIPLLALSACGERAPDRPTSADEERFHEIDAMLDDETAQQEGAAPEDATPPENRL